MSNNTGYGAIEGHQDHANDGDHPLQRRVQLPPSSSSNKYKLKIDDLFARPWVKVLTTLALIATMVISPNYHKSTSARDLETSSEEGHDENQELFYEDQLVNHFDKTDTSTWSNRYYKSTNYFEGPGHPIFLIVGGEGALDHGMLYPFVTQHLAPHFGAAVIEVEHRFYGPYQPIMGRDATVAELVTLLTPQQAMADMIQLAKAFKNELGCSIYDRSSENYCPIVTVGGSYPGFLSAMFRVAYPDFVDISYASSAPLKLYDQTTDQAAYYDIVTKAAEHTSEGCADAVRSTLEEVKELIAEASSVKEAVVDTNMCLDTLPEYITTLKTYSEDLMMAIAFSFANYDMEAYPPSEELGLYKACQVFQNDSTSPMDKVANFFRLMEGDVEEEEAYPDLAAEESRDCFDLSIFLPDGNNPRIATSDWSGSGGGNDGKMWDFQLCTTLVDPIGFSEESMFPAREWTYEELTKYCQLRWGKEITPTPFALVTNLGFADLVKTGTSRILFTNGLQDMWSGGSYLEDVSDSILALNFENGAHHSDLSHVGPSENDTEDIREGFVQVTGILETWLDEIKEESEN
eukprot:CAMPEP_0201631238 /NCGR_PEP_ID=MMETSP0493-20130528/5284_1 /ASSEMBLY_ACC=CAM_ASM_000838 /TAXON_ID=420259 /ORGANISM="Thalassiosira gravida, Strain GMp14c1" /LENGTH=574 /DNA_ID=CAMNT_0048102541 /DNA_START=159 /DNA_END=1883 /DNA_ORIENTATION=+